jgi:hypothetical protein
LPAVFEAYAVMTRHSTDTALADHLHRGQHVEHAQRHLHRFVGDLLAESADAGPIRGDIDAAELASFCLRALGAAADLRSRAAVHRVVTVTLKGLGAAGSTPAT